MSCVKRLTHGIKTVRSLRNGSPTGLSSAFGAKPNRGELTLACSLSCLCQLDTGLTSPSETSHRDDKSVSVRRLTKFHFVQCGPDQDSGRQNKPNPSSQVMSLAALSFLSFSNLHTAADTLPLSLLSCHVDHQHQHVLQQQQSGADAHKLEPQDSTSKSHPRS